MGPSLKRTIGVGTAWMSASTVVLKVIGLATIFLMLRKLSVAEYGLAELVLSVTGILSLFTLPGLNQLIIADMGIAKEKRDLRGMKELFVNSFYLQMILGGIAWALVFFGSNIIAGLYNEHIGGLFKIVSFVFLISPLRSLFFIAFSVELKFFYRSLYSTIEEALKLVLIVMLLYVFNLRVDAIVWAFVLSQFLAMIPMIPSLIRVTKYFTHVLLLDKKAPWTLLLNHGKWGIFATYFNGLGQYIRTWIIKVFLGTEAVGIFAVAVGLIQHTVSLVNLSGVLSPILPQYVHDKEHFKRISIKAIKYQILIFAVTGVIAYFTFVPAVYWLFPNYRDALPLFVTMLPVLIPIGFAAVFTPMFGALQAQKSLSLAILVKTLSIICVLPLAILSCGFLGIAYEYIITTVIFVIERYRSLKKIVPNFSLSFRKFFTFEEEDRVIVRTLLSKIRRSIG